MTDENISLIDDIDDDFSFEGESDAAPEEPSVHFGELQFYRFPVNKWAKSGSFEPFTLPGVRDDRYDNETKVSTYVGLKEFRRERLANSKHKLNILVIRKYNVDDEEYHAVKQWTNWIDNRETTMKDTLEEEKVNPVNWWDAYQFPAFKKAQGSLGTLSKSGSTALKNGQDAPGAWVPARWEVTSTGLKVETTINGELVKYTKTIISNIVLYSSKEEWEKAKAERFGDNGVAPASWYEGLELPELWKDNADTLKNLISDKREEKPKRIIDAYSLGENGEAIIKAALKDNPF